MEDEPKTDGTDEYVKPEIVDYGDLVELTAAQVAYGALDGSFPRPVPPSFS